MTDDLDRQLVKLIAESKMRHAKLRRERYMAAIMPDAPVDIAQGLCDVIDQVGTGRELSLAKTKIQEAMFWLSAHLTKQDELH